MKRYIVITSEYDTWGETIDIEVAGHFDDWLDAVKCSYDEYFIIVDTETGETYSENDDAVRSATQEFMWYIQKDWKVYAP